MAAIARGTENTTNLINWFTTINGILTDLYEVGFQIYDITEGLPGTQTFPATPGDWEDVTNAPGKFGVGSYYAYDNTAGTGWTPSLGETIGTHRITWRWKATSSSPYQAGLEDFEILAQSSAASSDTYCSVADIRAQGLDETVADDATVLAYIETWQQFLDRACRQWFNLRTMVFSVDGNNSDTLMLGVPIVSIDYIKINGQTEELNTDYYRVYNEVDYPDNRRNPRIVLASSQTSNIYTSTGSYGGCKFLRGRKNQEIKGTFGYVESDASTPKLIKWALIKLVIEKLTTPAYGNTLNPNTAPPIVGSVLEEWTDGHKVKYSEPGGEFSKRKPGLSGITQDREILDIIKLYRAPLGALAPVGPSY